MRLRFSWRCCFTATPPGVFSSRRIEKATYEMLPFRFIAGGLHPDHDTLANFRKTFRAAIKELFVQVLLLAQAAGYLTLGNISMDGSKVHANASKSKAVSYKRLLELETHLRAEVEQLFRLADQADRHELPDGMNVVNEIALRQEHLARLAEAKQVLQTRAQERQAAEQAEYEAKQRVRRPQAQRTGRKPRGRPPTPPSADPQDKDQYNFTDPESRIMKCSSSAGFEQAYNAQVAVDQDSLFIVACSVSNHPNDKAEAEPTWRPCHLSLGTPAAAALDNGFWSEQNLSPPWTHVRLSPTSPRAANRTTKAGKSALPPNPHRRPRMPVRRSRWPTSCAPRSARPSIACANAPSNR